MANNNEIAKTLIEAVGGKDNVVYFQHCTTRLRFNLKDRSAVDLKKIKDTEKVLGTQWSNDELQVIIGPAVATLYEAMCKEGGFEAQAAVDENLDADLTKGKLTAKGVITALFDAISGCITPIIPMMIGAGMIKVITMLLNMIGVLPAESSTYQILGWLGDAFTYYFPVYLGYTAARKFNANVGVSMLLGAVLVFPSFINAVNEGQTLTFLGLPVYATNYSSTVIPIIITVWLLAKVEKLVTKYSPDFLKATLVPTLSLVIMLPVMLIVTAPIGYYVGSLISSAIIWIYETIGFLGVAILCALLPLMVLTGMHTLMTPYWVGAFMTLGNDPFFLPAMIISNMNQGAAAVAVGLKAKTNKMKSTALSCAITTLIAGITEPTMFGITVPLKKPLYAAMIGNFVGGLIAGLLKVACYAFPGSGGIFALVSFVGPNNNMVWFLVAMIVGMVVTFALTMLFGFEEEE